MLCVCLDVLICSVQISLVSIAKPYKTVIPLHTWRVTWQSCPPSVVPGRVEFCPGTTLSVSLLVHLSACPRGLVVWRRQCVLFLRNTRPSILFYFVSLEMAKDPAHAAWPESWTSATSHYSGSVVWVYRQVSVCVCVCVCVCLCGRGTEFLSPPKSNRTKDRNKNRTQGSRQTPKLISIISKYSWLNNQQLKLKFRRRCACFDWIWLTL